MLGKRCMLEGVVEHGNRTARPLRVKLDCLNASHQFEPVASGGKVCETTNQLNLIILPNEGSIPVGNRINEIYQVTNGGPKSS